MTGKRLLVTGATGAIGSSVIETAHEHGYRLRVLARGPVPPARVPPGTEIVHGDVTDEAAVRTAVAGVDVVCHLAAKLHINEPSPALRAEYRRVNVDGTANVAGAAAAAGVRRLVHFSTISVYGPGEPGSLFDEESPLRPASLYAATKCEAEYAALAAKGADGLPIAVVLRVAAVYGARVKGNYRSLLGALQRGWFVPVGSGRNRRTLIHERDLASAALLAASHPAAAGRVYNVTDGDVHTFAEIVAAICAALGRNPPRTRVPLPLARTGAMLVDGARRIAGAAPRARPLLDKLTEDMAVSGRRIRDELGFEPRFDLSAGWKEAVARMDGT